MSEIRKLPATEGGRVETGPVQFGDDWPGVFIRGDNAFAYAMALQEAMETIPEGFNKAQLKSLCGLLGGAILTDKLKFITPPNSELLKMAEKSGPPNWLEVLE